MSNPARRRSWRERLLERAVARATRFLAPGEQPQAAAILQRGLKPFFAFLTMGVGAGLFVPALTSPDSSIPDPLHWYIGLPLYLLGVLALAIPGQALVVLTGGTAYVISRRPFPGVRERLLTDAPLDTVEIDLERGVATVAGHRLWRLVGRSSSLHGLAAAAGRPGPTPGVAGARPKRRRRRRGAWALAAVGAVIAVGLVLDAVIETDAEAIERVLTGYRSDLFDGRGDATCAALGERARAELVEEATARQTERPPNCERAVERGAELLPEAIRARGPTPPAILDIDVREEEATAKIGAPFAFQRIPLSREAGRWRLATLRAPAFVRDAAEEDLPTAADFAARAELVCFNNSRGFLPVAARFALAPPPSEGPAAARTIARALVQLSDFDRSLARNLSALTPPAGAGEQVERVAETLRTYADAREALAAVATRRDPATIEREAAALARPKQAVQTAAQDAGLAPALADCV